MFLLYEVSVFLFFILKKEKSYLFSFFFHLNNKQFSRTLIKQGTSVFFTHVSSAGWKILEWALELPRFNENLGWIWAFSAMLVFKSFDYDFYTCSLPYQSNWLKNYSYHYYYGFWEWMNSCIVREWDFNKHLQTRTF